MYDLVVAFFQLSEYQNIPNIHGSKFLKCHKPVLDVHKELVEDNGALKILFLA